MSSIRDTLCDNLPDEAGQSAKPAVQIQKHEVEQLLARFDKVTTTLRQLQAQHPSQCLHVPLQRKDLSQLSDDDVRHLRDQIPLLEEQMKFWQGIRSRKVLENTHTGTKEAVRQKKGRLVPISDAKLGRIRQFSSDDDDAEESAASCSKPSRPPQNKRRQV